MKPNTVKSRTTSPPSPMTPATSCAPPLPRPAPWTGKKVRDALASVKEFQGVTGQMKFQGTGDPVKSAVIHPD